MAKYFKLFLILSWLTVLSALASIFYLSSQPAAQSDKLSKKVTDVFIDSLGALAGIGLYGIAFAILKRVLKCIRQ